MRKKTESGYDGDCRCGENPLVIAGVMGSVDAEVEDSTTQIVLESPGLKRKSSFRFSQAWLAH